MSPEVGFISLIFVLHFFSTSDGKTDDPCHFSGNAPTVDQNAPQYFPASVMVDDSGGFTLKKQIDPSADVYGFFNDQLQQTGWGILEFRAGYGKRPSPLSVQNIFAAGGYLEGFLTARRIQQHRCNMFFEFFGRKPDPKKLEKTKMFMAAQDKWTRKMITAYGESSPYWRHVSYVTAQFDGLVKGYQAAVRNDDSLIQLEVFDFQVLNGVGDLLDLMKALSPESIPDFKKMTSQELLMYVHRQGHCSGLIKLLPGFENVFMSHSSWFTYSSTNRIYKHYDFNTSDPYTKANAVSFSSYPGFLESLDDYYLMNNGLVLIQTTNNVFNTSLYNFVKPQSLFAWQRVRVANHMAASGREWNAIFRDFNSGTYNNQYMILDLSKIKLRENVEDDALWVVEQVPTLVVGKDVTEILRTGYWPSYNVPFFEEIFNISGYPEVVAEKGTDFSYQLAPRAKIFRRDALKVKDIESMKTIMRYNDFPNDKYSGGSPWGAICSRGDLDPTTPRADGCYDTKLSDFKMALARRSLAINGPTRGTGLGPFQWALSFNDTYHWGTPPLFNFSFVEMRPILH